MSDSPHTLLVALGGNAIARAGDDGSVHAQYQRATEALTDVADLICEGTCVVLTHGNGPVVGNIMLRGEIASGVVAPMPLYIAGADSEGGIGLVLQQTLGNLLADRGCERPVVAVVTQVVVDEGDPAFAHPSKPIGPYYAAEQAEELASSRGWTIAEEPGRGWRRTVASPRPLEVVEAEAVRALMSAGVIAIAAGGGGVPVRRMPDGHLTGIDAVVDKDWAGAVLATELDVDTLAILMEADAIYRGWGTPSAERIERMTPAEAMALVEHHEFAGGSVAPKVAAAASYVSSTGGTAVICSSGALADALAGTTGTRIVAG